MTLAGVLDVGDELCQAPVHLVGLELTTPVVAVLLQLVPVAHDDERRSKVQTMIGTALQQHLVGLRVVVLGIQHAACRPVVQLIDNLLHRELTLHLVQLIRPLLQTLVTLEVGMHRAVHHLEVGSRQGDARQACCQTTAEVRLIDHPFQRQWRAGIDEVPDDVELLEYRVYIAVGLSVLLVVEGFELQRLLVDVCPTFLQRQCVVQLSVEGQHVQLHGLAIHLLHGIHHILNKLRVRGSCRMDAYHHLRLLGLLLVGTLRLHQLTIGVDGLLAHLVGLHDGC